jgi:pimeloyl-ACP methyl ester carboxylesterase
VGKESAWYREDEVMIQNSPPKFYISVFLSILLILLAACEPVAPTSEQLESPEAEKVESATQTPTSIPEEPTKTPVEEPTITPTATEVVEVKPVLPPEPIAQTILASDGIELLGQLYPAATVEAPMLVLFHWAPGDQMDWRALAPWLQNRGYQPDLPDASPPWLDPSWFPEMPEGVSFHVLTFTFRGCEGGCQAFDREGWLLDVAAVMDHLQLMEDVNFSQVGTIGASIGADGAAYGCHYHNEVLGGCQGALSLSPGGYLTIPYPEEVVALGSEDPPKPAWCLYSTEDVPSARACENTTGDHYRAVSYTGFAHGMEMLKEGQEPNPLEITLEFLNLTGLCADCP